MSDTDDILKILCLMCEPCMLQFRLATFSHAHATDCYLCHVGHRGFISRVFFSLSQIFPAESEAGIELSQSNGVEWHCFRGSGAKNQGWTIFRVIFLVNHDFSANFTSQSIQAGSMDPLKPDRFRPFPEAAKITQKNCRV
jgi:hypothetical protein